jgi:pimeloyl-ACP methyl ester carboxylesterase
LTYKFADINGARLHYEVQGSGPALVLIHAGIAHLDMWDEQVDHFASQYRVIRYDIRAQGRSSNPPGPYADYEDLRGLLDYLDIPQATILGASNGGRIAIDFTLTYPEQVSALITVAASLAGYEYVHIDDAILQKDAAIDQATEAGNIPLAVELETQFWVDGFKRTPDQVDQAVRAKAVEMNTFLFNLPEGKGEPQRLEPPAVSRLREIQVPTLAIVGDQDIPDMIEITNLLEKEIDGAKKAIMVQAAHMPSMEKPAQFNQIVLDFMREHTYEPG